MRKKVFGGALLLLAMALTTNGFAQNNTCPGTPTLQAIGVGSSGLYNAMSYAMVAIVSNNTFNTSSYSMISQKANNLLVTDSRFSTALNDTPTITVVWSNNDGSGNCNVYAYFSLDSGIGIKDFFAWKKVPDQANDGTLFSVAATYASFTGTFTSGNKVQGLPDNLQGLSALPTTIFNALNTPPVPLSKTDTPHAHHLDYCGYETGGSSKAGVWCYFNYGASDERPEDNLFMATRALSSIPTGGLTGLGYNNSACLAGTDPGATPAEQGCPIVDAFGQNSYFNVLSYKLSGTDPIGSGTIPAYSSLRMGSVPILVFVNNADSSNTLGFGATYNDSNGHSHYTFTNINRAVLSDVFQGTLNCTGDLLPGTPGPGNNVYDSGSIAGPPPGAGEPMQVIVREVLSGTYTAFEYTGVRTLGGSSNAATSKPTNTAWLSDDDSGQEYGNNPATNFSDSHCGGTVALNAGLTAPPDGTVTCGDPMYLPTPVGAASTSACGQGVKLRAIGTGEEVPAVIGTLKPKNGGSAPPTPDGIGYSFWSYGNLAPLATGCSFSSQTSYTCTNLGHYLTVDGVDPLFLTKGGEADSAYGETNNPNGAFNVPACSFTLVASGHPCQKLPFTHVYDGTYPLWSINTLVTFQNVGTGTGQTLFTPSSVLGLVANAEVVENNASLSLSDFVPVYKNINTSVNPPTGDLNVGVFRSHYKETNSPYNGHAACAGSFTGIAITGTTKGSSAKCLVDAGADAGGSVLTVQSDVDFNVDFGSLFNSGAYETYNLHQ
jgi:hypothetical protein